MQIRDVVNMEQTHITVLGIANLSKCNNSEYIAHSMYSIR